MGVGMRGLAVWMLVLVIGCWVNGVFAQPKWAVNQVYEGNIDIGGVQVPLPPGPWTVTGFQSSVNQSRSDGSIPGSSTNVALAQFAGDMVRAYIAFSYNDRSMSSGWTVPDAKNCSRQEIHHAKIVRDMQLDRRCQYVNHIVYSVGANSAQWWKDSIEFARKRGIVMPMVAIAGGIVVSDRANYVSATYFFNPAIAGFPAPQNTAWSTSDWNVLNVAGDEKKKAFVQSVIDWAEKNRQLVETGLAGKLKKGEGLGWPAAMQ